MKNRNGPGTVEWNYACRHVAWLGALNTSRRRVSIHADILQARHTTGGLATVLPADEFVAADFFLFLKGELSPEQTGPHFTWLPWSVLYLRGTPMFILAAEQKAAAQQIARALGLTTRMGIHACSSTTGCARASIGTDTARTACRVESHCGRNRAHRCGALTPNRNVLLESEVPHNVDRRALCTGGSLLYTRMALRGG
jgi:hypothetical protein